MNRQLIPSERRLNDAIEGFGVSADETAFNFESHENPATIAVGKSRIVGFTPDCGLFKQEKFIPCKYANLWLELELVSDPASVINVAPTGADASLSWDISKVELKAEIYTLDNAMENKYIAHLSSGKSLSIPYTNYTTISHVGNGNNEINLTLSRAVSRLKSVFITMLHAPTASEKELNFFSHPMGATYELADEVEFEVQIGNNRFPQYPIRSAAEAFYSLRKTLGINNSSWHSISLVGRWYRHDKFIVGIDLEKVEGADYTGYNNRNGDTMTVKIRNPQNPAKIFTTLYYDAVLEISDMGVRVSD